MVICVCALFCFLHSSKNCSDKCNHKNNRTAINGICQRRLQSVERELQMTDDAEV